MTVAQNIRVPLLYAANRSKIGSDPGLIHPGLTLTIPS